MNSYLTENKKEFCSGCSLCAFSCPTKALEMQQDFEGFSFPVLNNSLCVNCGKCAKVCPMDVFEKNTDTPKAFAAYSNDKAVLKASSSGGIFTELAKKVISEGGVVCGVTIDENHKVKHIVIEKIEDIHLLQGSKYVQSDLANCLKELSSLLKQGKKVLFTGTPCQVSAVKNTMNCDNLITVDLLCHGVPSQKLFDFYVKYLEEKHGGKLVEIVFRDKEKFGWSITQRYKIEKNGRVRTYYLERHTSEYFSGFLRNVTQRDACFNCPYTSLSRVGDITLADFWGVDKVRPDLLNLEGTSLILVNSENGEALISGISEKVVISEVNLNDAIYQNVNLISPPEKNRLRDEIYSLIFKLGFKKAGKIYLLPKNSWKYKIAQILNFNVMKKSLTKTKKN